MFKDVLSCLTNLIHGIILSLLYIPIVVIQVDHKPSILFLLHRLLLNGRNIAHNNL